MIGEYIANYFPDFFWALSAFVVFVLIVFKFGLKPLTQAIDAREKKIADDLSQAEQSAAKAKELQANLDEQLAGAEAKISAMMTKATRDAEEQKAEILEAGRKEVENFRIRALREIDAARHEAIVGLRNEVADVATIVAERILKTELDETKHQELCARAIDKYEAQRGA